MGAILSILGSISWVVVIILQSNPDLIEDVVKWYRRRKALKLKCKKHPKYKAIRKPTCSCIDCRRMWRARQRD